MSIQLMCAFQLWFRLDLLALRFLAPVPVTVLLLIPCNNLKLTVFKARREIQIKIRNKIHAGGVRMQLNM